MESALTQSVLVFGIEDRRFALRLGMVDRVVRAVEVTPVPDAPPVILGVINVQGRVVPVANTRRRLGLPEREIVPGDRFIIGRAARRTIALVADVVEGVVDFAVESGAIGEPAEPPAGAVPGVMKTTAGLVLLQDMERFLAAEEWEALEAALRT